MLTKVWILWLAIVCLIASGAAKGDWPEAFGLEDPEADDRANGSEASFGDGWMAFRTYGADIVVADSETGGLLLRISAPEESLPVTEEPGESVRILSFVSAPVTEGDRLAVFCDGLRSGDDVPATFLSLWEVPSGRLIGVRSMSLPRYPNVFRSLSASRLMVYVAGGRRFEHWSAEDFSVLPPIDLPEAFAEPRPEPARDGEKYSWHGEHFLAYAPKNETRELTVLDLVSADFEKIAMPEGYGIASQNIRLAGHESTCLVPARELSGDLSLGVAFFDLEERRFDRFVELGGQSGSGTMRGFFTDDGSWFVMVKRRLFSGIHEVHGRVEGFDLRVDGINLGSSALGVPYVFENGLLWFSPNYGAPKFVVAYRVPIGDQPKAMLWADSVHAPESDGEVTIEVKIEPPMDELITVRVETVGGTALAGEDFLPLSRMITIPAGADSVPVSVRTIRDQRIETDEMFKLRFSGFEDGLLFAETEVEVLIKGSSLYGIGPIEPWVDDVAYGQSAALIGDWIVQANQKRESGSSAAAPSVVRKRLLGGEWEASEAWPEFSPSESLNLHVGMGLGEVLAVYNYGNLSIYDPEEDRIVYRPGDFLNDTKALTDGLVIGRTYASGFGEYSWDTAEPVRSVGLLTSSSTRLAYADRFIVSSGFGTKSIEVASRADPSIVRTLIGEAPWGTASSVVADGETVVVLGSGGCALFHLDGLAGDGSGDDPEILNLRYPRERGGYYTAGSISNDQVLLAGVADQTTAVIDIYGRTDGEFLDRLEVSMPSHAPVGAQVTNLSIDEGDVVLAVGWFGSIMMVHYSLDARFPRVEMASPVLEGGGGIPVQLSEAAPWPMIVRARPILEDALITDQWLGVGEVVTVPSGVTSFRLPLVLGDDEEALEARRVRLEISVETPEGAGVRIVNVEVLDDDRVAFEDVVREGFPPIYKLQAFGQGWIGQVFGNVANENERLRWSDSPDFSTHELLAPDGVAGSYEFVATDGDWVALRRPAVVNGAGGTPAEVVIFKPREPETPVRVFSGANFRDEFGRDVLFADGLVWIGAPWIDRDSTSTSGSGKVSVFDLSTGLRKKLISPAIAARWNFGARIVGNAESVWIASPRATDEKGAVSQYRRSNYLRQRVIWAPREDEASSGFGSDMRCSADLLVVQSLNPDVLEPSRYDAFSSATGEHLWSLQGGGTMELVGELLMLADRSGFSFYDVSDLEAARLVLFVEQPFTRNDPEVEIKEGRLYYGVSSVDSYSVDLRQFSKLWPILGPPPGAGNVADLFGRAGSSLALEREGYRWLLRLPMGYAPPTVGELVVECSEDLAQWQDVALMSSSGRWALAEGYSGEIRLSASGSLLEIPADAVGCFFRLNWR